MNESTAGDQFWNCPNCGRIYPANTGHTCAPWQGMTYTTSFPSASDSANLARIAAALEEIVKLLREKAA